MTLEILRDLQAVYSVDPARVYALGFSQGGFFAAHAAMSCPDVFAAFAVQGSASPWTDDPLAAYAGKEVPASYVLVGHTDFIVDNAMLMHQALRQRGAESTLRILPGIEHEFQPSEVDAMVRFLLGHPQGSRGSR